MYILLSEERPCKCINKQGFGNNMEYSISY